MPKAQCDKCGSFIDWRNQRGVKLKDVPCPNCDGKLVYMVHDYESGEYVLPAERKRREASRRASSCRK